MVDDVELGLSWAFKDIVEELTLLDNARPPTTQTPDLDEIRSTACTVFDEQLDVHSRHPKVRCATCAVPLLVLLAPIHLIYH